MNPVLQMNDQIELWNDIALIKDDKYFTKWVKMTGKLAHHTGFLEYLKPYLGGVMLDVGANIGTHSIYYAQFGHVHAFEPNPIAFECLKHNLRDADATLYNLAVGATEHNISLSPQKDGNPGAIYTIPGDDIPVITIDSLCLEECNFIKIDVEGDELAVLSGAMNTIFRCKPIICIECNPTTLARKGLTSKDLVAAIHSLHYVCKQHVSDTDTSDLLCLPV